MMDAENAAPRLRDAVQQIARALDITEKSGGKSQTGLERFIKQFRDIEKSLDVVTCREAAFFGIVFEYTVRLIPLISKKNFLERWLSSRDGLTDSEASFLKSNLAVNRARLSEFSDRFKLSDATRELIKKLDFSNVNEISNQLRSAICHELASKFGSEVEYAFELGFQFSAFSFLCDLVYNDKRHMKEIRGLATDFRRSLGNAILNAPKDIFPDLTVEMVALWCEKLEIASTTNIERVYQETHELLSRFLEEFDVPTMQFPP